MGKLGWPVPGEVVGRFGVRVDPKYGTKTKNLGVDIDCAEGVPVKASYPGKVSYADRFMGYGRTVIVDHGERLHTIYAGLAEVRVSVGTQVQKGAVLAYSADSLQFQVRKDGQAEDPCSWLESR